MTSKKTIQRHQLAARIQLYGMVADTPCSHCSHKDEPCFVSPSEAHGRCASCVRRGRQCIGRSWATLDRMIKDYQRAIEKDEREIAALVLRMRQHMQALREAQARARGDVQYFDLSRPTSNSTTPEDIEIISSTVQLIGPSCEADYWSNPQQFTVHEDVQGPMLGSDFSVDTSS